MAVEGILIDAGFLGIAGFGVWRGQGIWSRHVELKHERETSRLSMDRTEKSIRLEIEQNEALSKIHQRDEIIATERLRVEISRPALEPGDP